MARPDLLLMATACVFAIGCATRGPDRAPTGVTVFDSTLPAADSPPAAPLSTLAPPPPAPVELATFSLDDQFGVRHTVRFPAPRLTVLAIADRDGSADLDAWTAPLAARFGERIAIVGVAQLAEIDPFFRGFVTAIIRNDQPRPVLLDWSGELTRRLDCAAGRANIRVLDTDGRLLARADGRATSDALAQIAAAIEQRVAN